ELRNQHWRCISPSWPVHRKNSQGRQADRPAGRAANQIRVGDQSQNREDAWPRSAALAAHPCRRGDRIEMLCAAVHEPDFGPQRTCASALHMSAFEGKADMTFGGSPLSRSLLGVKRTCCVALHTSAFDPKRTWPLPER